MSFFLSGQLTVAADELGRVRAALGEHERLTLAEPGCLRFEVSERGAGVFDVAESFADRAAFAAHQARIRGTEWEAVTVNAVRDYKTWEA